MEIKASFTNETALKELGTRLTSLRIERGWTQAALAEKSGIAKRTLERFESGGSIQLGTLIKLLRPLELIKPLNSLIPEPGVRPMELLKMGGSRRKRASAKQLQTSPKQTWNWSEDT